jgi:hypothetical protein
MILGEIDLSQEAPVPIPEFRPDGYLPAGLYLATEEEVAARFGQSPARRRVLMAQVSEWLRLARALGARRFLLNGSFVTAKPEPADVDAVCWLPDDFEDRYDADVDEAVKLYEMLATRYPAELFSVYAQEDGDRWMLFFSQTGEVTSPRKGLVEVEL